MSNWFTFQMWFNLYPGPLTPIFQYILVGALIAFVAGAIITKVYHHKYKKTLYAKLWASGFNFSITGVIIGLFLLFFTYEVIPFFSSRFWFLVWFLVHAVWGYFIYKKLITIPQIKEEIKAKKEFQRYIP